MNSALMFERFWSELERPGRPSAEVLPPPPELAGAVATATALRQYGQAIPAQDLDVAWNDLVARLDLAAAPSSVPASSSPPGWRGPARAASVTLLRPRIHWGARIAVAAVAAMVAIAMVSLRANPGSALYPMRLTVERAALALSPKDRSIHLGIATARLDDLLVSLRTGPVRAAPGLARSLVVNRSAAGRAGADLRDLDVRITQEVPPALRGTPSSIASSVRMVLGDLLPAEEPPPAQGGSPSPVPGGPSPGPGDDSHNGGSDEQGGQGDRRGGDEQQGDGSHDGSGSQGDGEHKKDEGSDSNQGSDSHGSGDGSDEELHYRGDSGSGSAEGSGD